MLPRSAGCRAKSTTVGDVSPCGGKKGGDLWARALDKDTASEANSGGCAAVELFVVACCVLLLAGTRRSRHWSGHDHRVLRVGERLRGTPHSAFLSLSHHPRRAEKCRGSNRSARSCGRNGWRRRPGPSSLLATRPRWSLEIRAWTKRWSGRFLALNQSPTGLAPAAGSIGTAVHVWRVDTGTPQTLTLLGFPHCSTRILG